jgi:ribulose-5-phosphate 4-epimerase/fuculose-1-phosphate aldolase
MSLNKLQSFVDISQEVGKRIDYVQGGGGNTSYKIDKNLMAVKASGYKLSDITDKEGYVVINYTDIIDYYKNVNLESDIDFEKESNEITQKSIVQIEGLKSLKPSVEAGFHSFLMKYVIHSHPVYANILCCSKNGAELAKKILKDQDFSFLWIPYINPGFSLTLKIKAALDNYIWDKSNISEVIFLENHGIIVSSDSYERALLVHNKVNNAIKSFFNINESYPEISIEKTSENTYISHTKYLNDFFKDSDITLNYFINNSLYPDQLVYLNNEIAIDNDFSKPETRKKLIINTVTGQLFYNASLKEVMAIEETLLGFIYVMKNISSTNLEVKTMSSNETDFINNWESEAYRKKMLGNS